MDRNDESITLDQPSASVEAPSKQPLSSQIRVDLAGLSDVGKVRLNNEDHCLILRVGRSFQTLMTNLPDGMVPQQLDEVGYGMLVADGMGGMAAGEVASELAVSTLVSLVLETPDWILHLGDNEVDRIASRMVERFRRVNEALIERAERDPDLEGMGTTLTLAVSLGRDMLITHVGDSRAYLFREGALHRLTRDHTVAQKMIDSGLLSPEDDGLRQFRHFLTQALGTKGSALDPEVQRIQLRGGDQIMLCTDGLTEMVDEDAIASVLREQESAADACRVLVDFALRNGGRDNVTVVVARYDIPVVG